MKPHCKSAHKRSPPKKPQPLGKTSAAAYKAKQQWDLGDPAELLIPQPDASEPRPPAPQEPEATPSAPKRPRLHPAGEDNVA